jgi:hypothetical protein
VNVRKIKKIAQFDTTQTLGEFNVNQSITLDVKFDVKAMDAIYEANIWS